ncbi:MAG: VanZ family protein [Sulfuricurvum sp.]|uniref:VanZ family protein n=1 Tax=Sulfuricurvum sp. TaxID=2025608 RepID=UPI002620C8D7|nr:VanZ family protein [Sulfuricurvum sp.]MDD2828477.1 VanZ family protein [Sulfuricurvum sp.]
MKTTFFKTSFFITFGVIEYLALTPQHIEVLDGLWDKQNHFAAFFVLYILLSVAYKHFSLQKRIAILLLIGVQIELTQAFIPGRFASTLDVVADSIGIAIGFVIHRYVLKKLLDL